VISRSDLLLIRHAETPWNRDGRLNSRTDLALSDRGRSQAAALATALSRLPIGHVVCSPMQRARETIEPLSGTPVSFDDRLLEVDFGRFEGLTREEATRDPAFAAWENGEPVDRSVAEPSFDAVERVVEACEEAAKRPGPIVAVVLHGMLLRLFVAQGVLGMPVSAFRALRTDNASSTYVLAADDGPRWRLAGLGIPPSSLAGSWPDRAQAADLSRKPRG
jgi:broad specificity phosphatase PhoE